MERTWSALEQLDQWLADGAVRGAAAAVWHRGDIVASREVGFARDARPVEPDTLFALASVSKPVTVAAIMRAVDMGELDLDVSVSSLLPEFAETSDPLASDVLPQLEALRDRVTLRQLLSHTSGLPENIGKERLSALDLPSLEAEVNVMCGLPLQSAPGEMLRYSNVGIGVAGRVLEHVTGQPVVETMRETILSPMNLRNIVAQPTPAERERVTHTANAAHAGTPAESYNSEWWQQSAITWGGYFGSPTDLARFAASFFPGESSPLSERVRREMTIDQTGGVPGGVNVARVHWERGAWGLGWEVVADKRNHWTGSRRSPATFCHWGQSGTLVWADPERELALAVFGTSAVPPSWPLRPPRWAALSDALVEAADRG